MLSHNLCRGNQDQEPQQQQQQREVNKYIFLAAKIYCLAVDVSFLAFAIAISNSVEEALPFFEGYVDERNAGPWIVAVLTVIELVVDFCEILVGCFCTKKNRPGRQFIRFNPRRNAIKRNSFVGSTKLSDRDKISPSAIQALIMKSEPLVIGR